MNFLQLAHDRVRILGFSNHLVLVNHAGFVLFNQVTIQRHHTVFGSRLDVRVDTEGFVIADQGSNGWRIDHDLKHSYTTWLIRTRHQKLRNHRLQHR